MKHILSVVRTNGLVDTYTLVTDDDQTEADKMNFASAVKDGEIFLGRVTRAVYRSSTYELVTATNETPIGYNPDHIIYVMVESPEAYIERIVEGLS